MENYRESEAPMSSQDPLSVTAKKKWRPIASEI